VKLREARAKKLLTARDLAKQARVSESNVYRIERGEWLPSLPTVRKLTGVLGINPEEVEEFAAAIQKAATRRGRPAYTGQQSSARLGE